jgi:hypothetical protein
LEAKKQERSYRLRYDLFLLVFEALGISVRQKFMARFVSHFLATMRILLPISVLAQNQSDAEILAIGHKSWIARQSKVQIGTAEERYATAIGTRVNEEIKLHPEAGELQRLDILLANIIKGSARLGDYLIEPTGNGRIYMMRASTLASESMLNLMSNRTPFVSVSQADVWNSFKGAKAFHLNNRTKIESAAQTGANYGGDQFFVEFESIGSHIDSAIRMISHRTTREKSNIFYLCKSMIELTTGKAPNPLS